MAEGGVGELRHRSERGEEGRTVVEQDRDGRVAERAPAETDGAVSGMMCVSLYGTAFVLGRDDVRAQSQGCQRTYGQTWNGTTIACLQRRRTGHEDEVAIILVAREDAVENDREVGRDEEERAEAEH